MKTRFLLAAMLIAATPAWAINKCTQADGRVTYQDAPCLSGKSEELKITDSAGMQDDRYGGYPGSYGYGTPSSAGGVGTSSTSRGYGSGPIYTGPRGGRYTVGPSGNKNYIPKNK